jgi:ABC-type dipeptide/oligopeptide/nickel transport system ATPase subunit
MLISNPYPITDNNADPGVQSSRFGTGRAFLIAVEQYEQVTTLSTPRNDVEKLAEVLSVQHGYDVHTLIRRGPGNEISKADLEYFLFEVMPGIVRQGDRVILYFAGHGIAVTEENPAEPRGFLLTKEARAGDESTYFPMSRLNEALHNLPCKHLLLLLDCCFAGAFQWALGARSIGAIPHKIYRQRFYDILSVEPAWQAIVSTTYNREALDSLHRLGNRPEDENRHSPFAWALIRALEDGDADTIPKGGDGLITVSELYGYLQNSLTRLPAGKEQKPAFFTLPQHKQGEFFFIHPVLKKITLEDYDETENPYCGLAAYDSAHRDNFYGRDKVVDALYLHLMTERILVVVGASGSGKSSVIKAGLIPRLTEKGYKVADMRPGAKPASALKETLVNIRQKADDCNVIFIDQFEEVMTLCSSQQEREEFLKALLDASKGSKVIITVRSDFEIFFKKSTIRELWEKGRFEIKNLDAQELRQIIKMPAIARSIHIDEEVVEELVQSTLNKPAALPLLAYTLTALHDLFIERWKRNPSTDREITKAEYEKVGRIDGILQTKANEILASLDIDGQRVLVNAMMRMVSLSDTGELVKSTITEKDIEFGDLYINKQMEDVLEKLISNRLIVSLRDGCYEPAHDALVRVWESLYDWRNKIGADALNLMEHLNDSVVRYEDSGKKAAYLWTFNPNRSRLLKCFHRDFPLLLNKRQQEFVRASQGRRLQSGLALIVFTMLLAMAGLLLVEEKMIEQRKTALETRKAKAAEKRELVAAQKAQKERIERLFQAIDTRIENAKVQIGDEKYESAIAILMAAGEESRQDSFVKQVEYFKMTKILQTRLVFIDSTIAQCEQNKILKLRYDQLMNQARVVEARGPTHYYLAMRLYMQAKSLGYVSRINPVQKNIDYMEDLLAKTFNEFMEDAEARWKANRPDLACRRLRDAHNITMVSRKVDKKFLKTQKEKYACYGF